jgi:2-haloalkanoic acid dehalogenase type II
VPIRAIVFDVFDTLVANGPDLWLESFQRICRDQGLAVEPQGLWDRWIILERGFRRRRLDPETLQLRQPFESYEAAWTDCFRKVFQQLGLAGDAPAATRLCIEDLGRRPAFPETVGVLAEMDGRWKLGALSNADRSFLYPLLDHHGIRGRFQAVLCSEEAQAYKPYPSLFHQVLQRLGVSPAEALQVGDVMQEDVRGAKLVGMQAAWVNRRGLVLDPLLPQPDFQLGDLAELLNILGKPAADPRQPARKRGAQ